MEKIEIPCQVCEAETATDGYGFIIPLGTAKHHKVLALCDTCFNELNRQIKELEKD